MKYIALEGVDLSGKSTQINLLTSYLSSRNIPVLSTKEPGGTKLGSKIREMVLQSTVDISKLSEFFLFMADRSQHYHEIMDKYLDTNTWVISDRCFMSTFAYQIYGRQLDTFIFKSVENIFRMVYGSVIIPDMIFYITIDLDTLRSRMNRRLGQQTKFEEEDDKFLERVISGYERAYQSWSNTIPIFKIDGTQNIMDIHQNIIQLIPKISKG